MPDRAFFFGTTAAQLWGMPVPTGVSEAELHVAVRAGERRVDAEGVRAHHVELDEGDCTVRYGVRLTSVGRTWCDLAASGWSLAELVAAGDFAIRRRAPLITRLDLAAAAARYRGRRGTRALRYALPLLSDRSDSAPESELRFAIIGARLPHPKVNHPIYDDRGRFIAQPDLVWPSHTLALEYEGDHHRTDRAQWHRDLERFADLQELGWTALRATAADYRDPGRLLARLARILSSTRDESTQIGRIARH